MLNICFFLVFVLLDILRKRMAEFHKTASNNYSDKLLRRKCYERNKHNLPPVFSALCHTAVDSNSDFHSVTIPQINAQNIN